MWSLFRCTHTCFNPDRLLKLAPKTWRPGFQHRSAIQVWTQRSVQACTGHAVQLRLSLLFLAALHRVKLEWVCIHKLQITPLITRYTYPKPHWKLMRFRLLNHKDFWKLIPKSLSQGLILLPLKLMAKLLLTLIEQNQKSSPIGPDLSFSYTSGNPEKLH